MDYTNDLGWLVDRIKNSVYDLLITIENLAKVGVLRDDRSSPRKLIETEN
jgi:hypothetical protein